jgi:G3E family GTPase
MLSIRERQVLPDRILIEASGVSNPFKIAQYAHLPGFHLDSVIVLADTEAIQKRAADKYVGRQVIQQLRSADLLLLNKVDLVSDEKRIQIKDWLQTTVPSIRLLEVSQGQVPVEMLFGEGLQEHLVDPEMQEGLVDDQQSEKHQHQHQHHHDQDYMTWSYAASNPLNGEQFSKLVAGLDAGVLRGKGFLYLEEDPSVQFIFQLVGKRWSIEKGRDWAERIPKTQFVLIALPGSLDAELLEKTLQNMTMT